MRASSTSGVLPMSSSTDRADGHRRFFERLLRSLPRICAAPKTHPHGGRSRRRPGPSPTRLGGGIKGIPVLEHVTRFWKRLLRSDGPASVGANGRRQRSVRHDSAESSQATRARPDEQRRSSICGCAAAGARRTSRPKSPHRPGCVPGATALRILLAHSGRDVSEAMAFGLAGGVGIGVFSFLYEKADFASLFVGGRHLWHDDRLYLERVCKRLGLKTVVKESTAPKAAEKNLRSMLAEHGPCVAWVDMAGLPHRALPTEFSGGGYHIVTVYSIDDAAGTALSAI